MQKKHLIAFTLASIFMLLGFNIINNRPTSPSPEPVASEPPPTVQSSEGSSAITTKPLGEQPKATLDKATTQIEQAEQADADRLAQMDANQ